MNAVVIFFLTVFALVPFSNTVVFTGQSISLPQIIKKPSQIIIIDNQIYINEGASIYLYQFNKNTQYPGVFVSKKSLKKDKHSKTGEKAGGKISLINASLSTRSNVHQDIFKGHAKESKSVIPIRQIDDTFSKDVEFVRKFGKKGEGPQEFKLNQFRADVHIFYKKNPGGGRGELVVNSVGRLSFFDLQGNFLDEKKVNPFYILAPHKKDLYVGIASNRGKNQGWLSLNIFNSKFEKVKELHATDKTISTDLYSSLLLDFITLPCESFVFREYDNKIFFPVEHKNGLAIKRVDSCGKLIDSYNIPYNKIKVPDSYKKNIRNWFKNRSPFKNVWPRIKDSVRFNSYFPALKNMFVDNNNIYIITYKKDEWGNNEFLVLDMKKAGEKRKIELKTFFMELPEEEPFNPACYTIKNNHLYSLHENEDIEMWELQIESLNEKLLRTEKNPKTLKALYAVYTTF